MMGLCLREKRTREGLAQDVALNWSLIAGFLHRREFGRGAFTEEACRRVFGVEVV